MPDDVSRRQFLTRTSAGIGAAALSTLMASDSGALPGLPHFAPKAKRVIYLFQFGGPSQIDLFDPKPGLAKMQSAELPASIRMGQRLTTMTAGQSSFPIAAPMFRFSRHGQSGASIS